MNRKSCIKLQFKVTRSHRLHRKTRRSFILNPASEHLCSYLVLHQTELAISTTTTKTALSVFNIVDIGSSRKEKNYSKTTARQTLNNILSDNVFSICRTVCRCHQKRYFVYIVLFRALRETANCERDGVVMVINSRTASCHNPAQAISISMNHIPTC